MGGGAPLACAPSWPPGPGQPTPGQRGTRSQQAPPRRHLTLIEAAEREAIIKALAAAGGNKSEAAGLLGIGRTTLYRRLRQLGLADDEGSL